jgi:hypothetical protein
MEDSFIRIFFSLCALLSLFCVFKTKIMVNLTAKWFKWNQGFMGFEGEIKPTPKAEIICRYWNLFMFCVFILMVIFLPKS